VADRFMEAVGSRPDSGPDESRGVCLYLYWSGKKADISLDVTGAPLPKRGYRTRPHSAPMQETLAAAVLRALDYDPDRDALVNPMAGSGTLAIEAALMARRMAPGLLRDDFAFTYLREFDANIWDEMKDEARSCMLPAAPRPIVATDNDPAAIEAARANAAQAGVADDIEFAICDFTETRVPDAPGVAVFNPEYGERMGDASELAEVYAGIGDYLKQNCAGYRGGVFTCAPKLAKRIGLRADAKVPFHSARLDCLLHRFDIWEGSRR
jgi:putative N6-adenine-specific DNA methylase